MWIYGELKNQHILEKIGIKLRNFKEEKKEGSGTWWNCSADKDQLIKLDNEWLNNFIWGLEEHE